MHRFTGSTIRALALLALLALCAHRGWAQQAYIPDNERTPGAINPEITQGNIARTVCVPGYTKKIRPPSSYTNRLKAHQMLELDLPGSAHDYHEDHLVPLCVGGHPSDPRNLWPEPVAGRWSTSVKDQLESSVCRQVCRGDITLEEGRAIFLARDWTRAYVKYFGVE